MQTFDDESILLLPRKCVVESRSECDAGISFGERQPMGIRKVNDVLLGGSARWPLLM